MNPIRIPRACAWMALGAAALFSAAAQAESAYPASAVQRYQQEMAFCKSGKSTQDMATCTREARNALAESRRGGLTSGADQQLQANASQRCDALQGIDRSSCMSRMSGGGSTSGSVSGGGILRESVVIIPSP